LVDVVVASSDSEQPSAGLGSSDRRTRPREMRTVGGALRWQEPV